MQWTNQNSKKLHVADVKRRKTCALVAVGLGLTSDWIKKSAASFLIQSCSVVMQTLTHDFSTLKSAL